MNIQSILFICNDFARAKFTLENFSRWNPEIPITIINSGGECPKPHLSHIKNTQFTDAPNLWHKKTHCGKGSFDFRFFEYLFKLGSNNSYSHTLLLETDVLTNRKITKIPLYDISGVTNFGGDENVYKYLNLNSNRLHSGCGGTIFSTDYFNKIIKSNNYYLFKHLFEKFPQYYYADFISTIVGLASGCSLGNWQEVSETKPYSAIENGNIYTKNPDVNATLVHNFKV